MADKKIPDTANDWIIELQEHPEDHDLCLAFDSWLALSEENRQEWGEAQRVWQLLGMTTPSYPELLSSRDDFSIGRVAPINNGEMRHCPANSNRRFFQVALVASILLLVFMLPKYFADWQADYVTRVGEYKEITLSDGSQVYLAPETAVKVSFEATERNIELLRGEAFFEVRPDAERPFSVRSQDVTTTVLGTAFNVDSLNNDVDVAVQHGLVQVNRGENTLGRLTAGQAMGISETNGVHHRRVDVQDVASWRSGELIVEQKPVQNVVEELNRYFKGWVTVHSQKLEGRKLTGVYNLKKPISALSAIADTYGAEIYQVSPWLIVITD